jgi:hypothetical protein
MKELKESEDILIEKMLEETFETSGSIASDEDDNVLDLENYFESRVRKQDQNMESSVCRFLESHQVNHVVLNFNQKNHCFRLRRGLNIIDFPGNWSVFQYLQYLNDRSYIQIDDQQNIDALHDVLRGFFDLSATFVICRNKNCYKIFFIQKSSAQFFQIMKSLFVHFDFDFSANKAA